MSGADALHPVLNSNRPCIAQAVRRQHETTIHDTNDSIHRHRHCPPPAAGRARLRDADILRGRGSTCAGLACQATDQDDRRPRGRNDHRPDHPLLRGDHPRRHRADSGDREQTRRRQQPGGRDRRPLAGRRLYRAGRRQQHPRRQHPSLQEAQLRSVQGLRARRHLRAGAVRAADPSGPGARTQPEGLHRIRQGQPRQAELRQRDGGRAGRRRAVETAGRLRRHQCQLQGQSAGDGRPGQRPARFLYVGHLHRPRAGAQRPCDRAGDHRQGPDAGCTGHPDDRRTRLSELRLLLVAGGVAADGVAAGGGAHDERADQQGDYVAGRCRIPAQARAAPGHGDAG